MLIYKEYNLYNIFTNKKKTLQKENELRCNILSSTSSSPLVDLHQSLASWVMTVNWQDVWLWWATSNFPNLRFPQQSLEKILMKNLNRMETCVLRFHNLHLLVTNLPSGYWTMPPSNACYKMAWNKIWMPIYLLRSANTQIRPFHFSAGHILMTELLSSMSLSTRWLQNYLISAYEKLSKKSDILTCPWGSTKPVWFLLGIWTENVCIHLRTYFLSAIKRLIFV